MENTTELFTDLIQYLHNKKYYEQINMNSLINSNVKYENKLETLSKYLDNILLIESKISYIQAILEQSNNKNNQEEK